MTKIFFSSSSFQAHFHLLREERKKKKLYKKQANWFQKLKMNDMNEYIIGYRFSF